MRLNGARLLRSATSALLAFAAAAAAADVVFRTFDDDAPGTPPPGFMFRATRQQTTGDWEVRGEGPQRHLEHVANPLSAKGLSLAIVGPAVKEVHLSVKLRLVDGERIGGLVWRYQDANDFYAAAVDLQQQEVALYRVTRGNRIQLDRNMDIELDHELWRTLSVVHQGDEIHVQLDGIGLLHARDRGFVGAGRAGVWSGGASRSWFDDLRIEDRAERRW